jgi:hypothetical protein
MSTRTRVILIILGIGLMIGLTILRKTPEATFVPNTEAPVDADRWIYTEEVSAMDKVKTVRLSIEAQTVVEGWLTASTPRLQIECSKGKSIVWVHTGQSAQPNGSLYENYPVRIKFDDAPLLSQKWMEATNFQALGTRNTGALLEKMRKAKTFLFEFTPFQKTEQIVRFDVRGLEKHFDKFKTACQP